MATNSSVLAWRIPGTGEAWWAAVYGVTQSRTQLKRLSSSSSSHQRTLTQKVSMMTVQKIFLEFKTNKTCLEPILQTSIVLPDCLGHFESLFICSTSDKARSSCHNPWYLRNIRFKSYTIRLVKIFSISLNFSISGKLILPGCSWQVTVQVEKAPLLFFFFSSTASLLQSQRHHYGKRMPYYLSH